MSRLRFVTGEVAIFAVPTVEHAFSNVGEQVVIMEIGPFKKGDMCRTAGKMVEDTFDYVAEFSDGLFGVKDWQLAKLNPPAEPESITRREEVEA